MVSSFILSISNTSSVSIMSALIIGSVFVCLATLTNGAYIDYPVVTQITEPIDHAEGPTWDVLKNMLFYVDIHSGRVYSYNYTSAALHYITLDGEVTPVVRAKYYQDMIVVGLNRSIVIVEWDGSSNEMGLTNTVANLSDKYPQSRVNDGKVDHMGRFWIGTMGPQDANGTVAPNEGVLYMLSKGNLSEPEVKIAPVNLSNGLTWNADNNIFYYIDTPTLQVFAYDYDDENGTISNQRVIFDMRDYPELAGHPDGMTIDEDGNLWVALYGGGSIIKVNPEDGTLLQRVALPARDVTSVMWGGPELDVLFVTTSRWSLTAEQRLIYPEAGSVYAITNLHTKGLPVYEADILQC